MRYVINVDVDNLNYPGRTPTGCAYHPDTRPHYDITIHVSRHSRTTRQEFRYWVGEFDTLEEATRAAEQEVAQWGVRLEVPILIRIHDCALK